MSLLWYTPFYTVQLGGAGTAESSLFSAALADAGIKAYEEFTSNRSLVAEVHAPTGGGRRLDA
jgi:hypothetical protein